MGTSLCRPDEQCPRNDELNVSGGRPVPVRQGYPQPVEWTEEAVSSFRSVPQGYQPPPSNSYSSMGAPPQPRGWSGASGPASGGFVSRSNCLPAKDTVIIWDWDDTLMCSTAIHNRTQVSPHLEYVLEEALQASIRLGETIIVTNADDSWVLESCRQYSPKVQQLLKRIPIHSARQKHEKRFPGDVKAWKHETFKDILSAKVSRGLNLVVLGDSTSEMDAARTSTSGLAFHSLLVKTIKFKDSPTCEEVCEQLRKITVELPVIVQDEKSRDLVLDIRASPQQNSFHYGVASPTSSVGPHLQQIAYLTTVPSMNNLGRSGSFDAAKHGQAMSQQAYFGAAQSFAAVGRSGSFEVVRKNGTATGQQAYVRA